MIATDITVSTLSKRVEPLLLGALGLGRVVVAPVQRLAAAREDRTGLAAWSHTVTT